MNNDPLLDDTMTAWVFEAIDAPLVERRLPRPEPAPGQVLVRVRASGINPLDLKIRAGKAAHAQSPAPAILGMDLAGEVIALGVGVHGFCLGDRVYGLTGGIGGIPGSLAEYAAVDAALLARAPVSLDWRELAALPLITITAWEGLVDRARVMTGQRVLVHGGAGGVGHIAIQIARAFGATVYATGSAAQKARIEALGAVAIDYQTESVEDYVERLTGGDGFDIVYDTVGGAVLDASFQAVRRYGGHVVSSLGWGEHRLAPLSFRAATYSGVFTLMPLLSGRYREAHGRILTQVARLADAGHLRPQLDPRGFALDQVNEAHAELAAGRNTGKLVLNIN